MGSVSNFLKDKESNKGVAVGVVGGSLAFAFLAAVVPINVETGITGVLIGSSMAKLIAGRNAFKA